jgi:NitT/TauT family transport system substrate-binding protein
MKITLYENLRGVPYVPYYAALKRRAFLAEGLEVTVETSPDPTQTANALLEGKADVAWGGPARVLHHYELDPNCALVCFCQVVARDPFFLVGRVPNSAFAVSDLLDARIATVAEVPTPWLCLQHDLRLAGIDPNALTRIADRSMAENVAGLRAGQLDVIQLYEPYVDELISKGDGHVWCAAADRGDVAYTTFYTKSSFARDNPDVLRGLTRGMYRTLKWLHHQPASTIAKLVSNYFPRLPRANLEGAIDRYLKVGLWGHNTLLGQRGFEWLQSALKTGDRISTGTSYQACVTTQFDESVIVEDPNPMR